MEDITQGPWAHSGLVVYARHIVRPVDEPSTWYDVYMFDLSTCREHVICEEEGIQFTATTYDDQLFWSDARPFGTEPSGERFEIYMFDTVTWTEHRLTDSPTTKGYPLSNGSYVVFWDSAEAPDGEFGLTLMELNSSDQETISPWQAAPEIHSISERYVAWTAYSLDATPSYDKNAYYYDLQTKETRILESTREFDVRRVAVSNGKIMWSKETTDFRQSVMLHDIETETNVSLTEDSYWSYPCFANKGLAVWMTSKFAPDPESKKIRDIVIFDLETGVERRVTNYSDSWGANMPDPPWLVLYISGGRDYMDLFALNLVKAGILDEFGRVIPQ
jgi:hypothetical protein